ncbi:MAG: hypothetical protein R3F59_13130 [Myxococcota bacterium]
MRLRFAALAAAVVSVLACSSLGSLPSPSGPVASPTRDAQGKVVITIRPDGTFDPPDVQIHVGDTVAWALPDRYRDSVAPTTSVGAPDACRAIAPYRGGPDDFTGPMPRNASGVFVLNADGPGLVESGGQLREGGPEGGVLDANWRSPKNVGAFLRLRWNWIQPDGPGRYDWTILDREVEKAVANGKLYSIAVKAGDKGTPGWIFRAGGVQKLTFREFGTHAGVDDCKCGAFMELGSPTDPKYQQLYFDMLQAVAEHLKSNAAWYRSLAYVKPSGANLYSAENRLPKRCSCEAECPRDPCKVPREFQGAPGLESDGRICNTKVWAEAGYTPEGLYRFYDRQFELMADAFPEKDLAYLLIHDGFPRVGGRDAYLECGEEKGKGKSRRGVPPPVDQTKEILQRGWKALGPRFAMEHAGLRPDRPINNLIGKERQDKQIVGLQTTNDVTDAAALGRTVQHALDESAATFVEVYEAGAWDADREGARAKDWSALLHARRLEGATAKGPLADPFPVRHEHTFGREGTYGVVDPYRCGAGGVIRVVR